MNLSRAMLLTALGVLTLFAQVGVAKDKKDDPEEIGNRDVGKGVNF